MGAAVNINLDIIPWAIDRAGYDFNEFAEECPRINVWLNKEKTPTIKQLEKFSNKVHLPFGYLFLSEPPKETIPIPFFRTGYGKADKVSLNLYEIIQVIQRRQDWLSEYLRENKYDRLDFVGKQKKLDVEPTVKDIRNTLNLDSGWARSQRNWIDALEYLTLKIEEVGILVTFSSIVENNPHRSITPQECRGFVLSDEYAPFMFINSADTKAAQLFTIAHELAHIWLGASAGFDFRRLLPDDDPVEIVCDKIAAELLVPQESFIARWKRNPEDYITLARIFKVSPIVVARRAMDLNKITKRHFFKFYYDYMREFRAIKKAKSSGGNFYATTKKRLSLSFAAHVDHAVKQNKLLYRDACKLTGLKTNTYEKFIKQYL